MFLLFLSFFVSSQSEMVENWSAKLVDHPEDPENLYRAVFEWDHHHEDAVLVDYVNGGSRVRNAANDARCAGDSDAKSPRDNQPYWMPRFNSRQVSDEITKLTGIRWASIDWQPCGHKDITICHAESHYDVHFYYVEESTVNGLPMCDIGSEHNPNLPVCRDSETNPANADYFRTISDAMPTSMEFYKRTTDSWIPKNVDFCVDPSSAILRSGVHYGDRSETLREWKTPVTIIGSHDCKLMFFEPMISWNWISGNSRYDPYKSWPKFEVRNIEYSAKEYKPLPTGWSIEASEGCNTHNVFSKSTDGACHITLTVDGVKCGGDSCAEPVRKCGQIKDCNTQQTFKPKMSPKPTPEPTNAPTVAPTEVPSEVQNDALSWEEFNERAVEQCAAISDVYGPGGKSRRLCKRQGCNMRCTSIGRKRKVKCKKLSQEPCELVPGCVYKNTCSGKPTW